MILQQRPACYRPFASLIQLGGGMDINTFSTLFSIPRPKTHCHSGLSREPGASEALACAVITDSCVVDPPGGCGTSSTSQTRCSAAFAGPRTSCASQPPPPPPPPTLQCTVARPAPSIRWATTPTQHKTAPHHRRHLPWRARRCHLWRSPRAHTHSPGARIAATTGAPWWSSVDLSPRAALATCLSCTLDQEGITIRARVRN